MYTLDCWKDSIPIHAGKAAGPVRVSVPARFDFIGGWTDTPPYYFENGGCVLNATLSLSQAGALPDAGQAAITVAVRAAAQLMITENGAPVRNLTEHIVLLKTLEFMGLSSPDIHITITNSIPKGSGLGGSSLLTAAILAALRAYYCGPDSVGGHLCTLVNNVLLIEQFMESGGGWQDQIGGIFPGVKLIRTVPDNPCSYYLTYLDSGVGSLNEGSLIIDTRVQRKAARILSSIRQKYIDRDPGTIAALKRIAKNAPLGFQFLREGDIRGFAHLLSESWEMVNSIESGSIELVDLLKALCGRDLLGLKIGGAGGGGFVLALFPDRDIRSYYSRRIREALPQCFLHEPVFGGSGLMLRQEMSEGSRILEAGFTEKLI
ncbi:MAG: GHMP family kinase ATP-binding protein [Candidatus Latescibacterota bacterium]